MMDIIEDQENLFQSYPCAYYVQSPSTISHANSADIKSNNNNNNNNINFESSTFHSPTTTTTLFIHNKSHPPHVSPTLFTTLSRYSSSHGSNHSFFFNDKIKNIAAGDDNHRLINKNVINRVHHHGHDDDDDDDDDDDNIDDEDQEQYYYGRNNNGTGWWWWKYCSFGRDSSCAWVSLQITWRLFFSLGVALLVFYVATKPPPPNMSIKVAGMKQFVLAEGVDASGVTTKILTCNCSVDLLVENKSKLFGLHINPPILEMSLGHFPFAMSHGSKLYAESHGWTKFQLNVGARNKPMYGAGRNMQDMLESGNGLPLAIHIKIKSNFRVVWNLIKAKFHHRAECLLVLGNTYDKKHQTQAYNSTCTILS